MEGDKNESRKVHIIHTSHRNHELRMENPAPPMVENL